MRRFAALGLALALAAPVAVARADLAPPPLAFIDVTAGDLTFLVITHDYTRPTHPTAQLISCLEGKPNCALARAKGLIGKRVVGFDGKPFDPERALRSQIFAAFLDKDAPATIEVDFEPQGESAAPLAVVFARR